MPARRDLANAIRILAMDAVQQANSGHPGMPMGMADIAEVLFNDHLRMNPGNPDWVDRDRFLLSNGHGSMLQYAALHLTGYELSLDDIKRFRQLHSKTPGHPENFMTPGVETTTGPLGQGLANAVGMALAEAALASRFNKDDATLVDHHTWCFAGDGCLMEGISHEACSLAGTLGLGKLIVFYDDNGISIDGETRGWFTEDVPARFEAYGWQVVRKVDGHDPEEINTAIETAKKETTRPTLICCRTVIGWGAPSMQGTAGVHGAALGDDEIAAARAELGWSDETRFAIPDEIYAAWDKRQAGADAERDWLATHKTYAEKYPEDAAEFSRRMAGQMPRNWSALCREFIEHTQSSGKRTATRKSSKATIGAYAAGLPELFGGSADLSGSNGTDFDGHKPIAAGDFSGNYLYYGVREFAMTAITNGMSLHGGFTPFGGTFLTFSDYARNAVRMAALMRSRNILVYTHDSIGLGEDGPTHQAVEHVASLRLIPNLHVWRPGDDVEVAVAWQAAIERANGPTALALSRQDVDHQDRDADQLAAIARGGYVLREPADAARALVIATGSELELAVAAARTLEGEGIAVRVVSMPCLELFNAQSAAYRASVLPAEITARVAVEAGVSDPWYRLVGANGRVIGVDDFGASAPGDEVYRHFGLTADAVAEALREQVRG
ncbi:transketolase [Salinisphaera orenii]|uniref:Transketolase n=1 Tax=Salinisphaera orenii YIM 95161 TaxID=1051139 RepID=A0A423PXN4_9GAMM|nr:transketolase [Salinisphaera halophila]ROO30222.1 transketolase [Salinisphaera halophila YIM 95161]